MRQPDMGLRLVKKGDRLGGFLIGPVIGLDKVKLPPGLLLKHAWLKWLVARTDSSVDEMPKSADFSGGEIKGQLWWLSSRSQPQASGTVL